MAQEAGRGETFEDTGELDTSQSARRVWLVKMPQFILDAWKQAGPDAELGRVRVTQKGNTTECLMSLSGSQAANIPKEYHLNLTPSSNPMYAFSEDAQGSVALAGVVKNRGDVGPLDGDSAEYRNLMRKRTQEGDAKTRGVQQYNDAQMPQRSSADRSRVFNAVTGKRKDVRRVANEPPEKRERMDEDQLQALLFQKFERGTNFSLKQLTDYTQQPQVWLKQVLGKLCVYVKRGENKNTYELKDEYKTKRKDQASTTENDADKAAASYGGNDFV